MRVQLDPTDFGDSGNSIIIPDFKTSRPVRCEGRNEGGLEKKGNRTGIMEE